MQPWSCHLWRAGRTLVSSPVHDGLTESLEFRSLEGLGHIVSLHLVCWAVLDGNIALFDLVGNKEIPNVNVSGSLAHALVAVLLQADGTLVIL